jgi:hypothetical protein
MIAQVFDKSLERSGGGIIRQWLRPGAGTNLLRSTGYFNGHGASSHLIVLIVLGLAAIAAVG